MKTTIDLTKMTREELETFAMEALTEAEALKQKVDFYEEQLRLMRQKKFGTSSEKNQVDENQLSLFNDAENEADLTKEEPKMENVRKVRNAKKKGEKDAKTKKLEKKVTEYTLNEKERICPACGQEMAKRKTVVRKEIELIPARFVEHTHITHVYVCKNCEKTGTNTPIISAPAPASVLEGSLVSPSLAAYLICRKYENRDTVYKMERDMKAAGLNLSKQTISNWILRTAERYGKPLYEKMQQHLLSQTYLHADETTVEVLHEEGRKPQSKSYMWLFCNGQEEKEPIFVYHYAATRSGKVAQTFLKGYQGILQCDGYDGYNQVENILRMGCLAHVKRKYVDAKRGMNAKLPEEAYEVVNTGIAYCDRLFQLDEEVKQRPLAERKAWKEENLRNVMNAFFQWAQKEEASSVSGTLLQKALRYTLNERVYLETYFTDGRIELSNNRAERGIRPFVMGRKNWLFCNTPRGADSSAIWYSLVETAKANQLKPYDYVAYILNQMRGKPADERKDDFLEKLLPWSKDIPEECKVTGKE